MSAAGLELTMKVGGCEALRDMYEARVIGVARVVGPMIESPYALQKYLAAVAMAFPEDERESVTFAINIETKTGMEHLDEMFELPEFDQLDGVVLGRVDMTQSLGLTREDINDPIIFDIAKRLFSKAKERNLECALGGGLGAESLSFMRRLPAGLLDRFETRKVIFSCPVALKNGAEEGILKAVGFELMWLKNKRDFYGSISREDEERINMLESRYNILINGATVAAS